MPGFIETIYLRFISPYTFLITVIFTILLFSVAGYYAYTYYNKNKPEDRKFKDLSNVAPNGQVITIYMFHVDWCPHCKVALPEWKKFEEEYNQKTLNGYTLEVSEINCTDDKSPQVNSYLEKYNVESFPTIKAIMKDADNKEIQIDFEAKANYSNLEKFAQSVSIGNNTSFQ